MDYRGDSEPEYIDDDEFFDPDDTGDGGGRRSNVLGGSGSRQARADNRGLNDENNQAEAGRKPAKARNPAPSVASSEERRARLAGKHQAKSARPQRSKRPENDKTAADTTEGKSRGWRKHFSRSDKSAPDSAATSASKRTSRIATLAGKLSALRGRLRRQDSKDERTGTQRQASESSGGRFGASRGTTRPTESRHAGSPSRQRDDRLPSAAPSRASKTPKIASGDWLDLDRKLDLIGVGLVFGAIVFFFSALSPEQAAIGAVHTILGQLLGWGAVAMPAAMFAIGIWLIVRHFGEAPPVIDLIRLAGATLAFLGALVLMQFVDSLGYPEQCGRDCIGQVVQAAYQDGRGGGLIGGWLYSALVINLTELGGFVVVFMALTIATMLATRSSMVELSVVVISLSRNLRSRIGQAVVQRRAQRLQAQRESLAAAQEESHVRVRKPEPAQLAAASTAGQALPAPSSYWMPIPNRLRAFLDRRRKSAAADVSEPLAIERPTATSDQSMMQRFLSRRTAESAPAQAAQPTGPAGRLERFLNLGDDLPPPALDSSASTPRISNVDSPPPIAPARPSAPYAASRAKTATAHFHAWTGACRGRRAGSIRSP